MNAYVPQKLPIQDVDWKALIPFIGPANRALASFDGVLYGLPNPEILLAPMTTQEAVLSSRIEGTQATLGEVLKFEAGDEAVELLILGAGGLEVVGVAVGTEQGFDLRLQLLLGGGARGGSGGVG